MGIESYSSNPDLNQHVGGIFIGEGMTAADMNNAMRQFMADMRTFFDAYVNVSYPITLDKGGTGATTAASALAALGGLSSTYKRLPQSLQTGAFTFDLSQDAAHVYYTGAAAAATIPPNSSVPFIGGTAITIVNNGTGVLTITRGAGVTLKWANTGANGDRALAVGGMATILKVDTDLWFIGGGGLT